MEQKAHVADGHVDDRGDFAVGETLLELEPQHFLLAVGQLADAGFDAILPVSVADRASFDAFDDALRRCGQRGPGRERPRR